MKYHRLSRYKIKRIILCFAEDITASSASKILRINRNTINAYYNEIREKILQHSLKEHEKELGEFELDESYFGARRVRWKRGRGAAGNCPKLFERRTDAYYSRENPDRVDDSHRWLEGLQWPHFERLQPLPSLPL